jgi:hypothetical protein
MQMKTLVWLVTPEKEYNLAVKDCQFVHKGKKTKRWNPRRHIWG